ncbi:MAG TPA: hypothetical protein DCE55_23690 [Planctomycetaceae bacterium]|nr:hypothetical protein [Planctomycetaceae bacterium]
MAQAKAFGYKKTDQKRITFARCCFRPADDKTVRHGEFPVNAKAAALLMVGLLGAPVVFHLTQPDWEILQQADGYRFMFNRRTGEFFVPGVTGVHSPGEKLVPIASKKKSVEQQARKTLNKNELGERKSKKIGFDWTQVDPEVQDGAGRKIGFDWTKDIPPEEMADILEQMEAPSPSPTEQSLGDRLIDVIIVTSGETLLMCAVVSLIGFVWFYFKPAPTDSDD